MTFEQPSAVWWALVAVPVLILYLARLNVHRETVGTGMFWRQVLPKTNPLLRRLASLAAQLVLMGLLVTALARLYLSPDVGSRRIVLIVDNSPSMAADADGKTRLSAAIKKARRLVGELRIGDEMAIFATSPVTRVVCRMTRGRQELLKSLDTIMIAQPSGEIEVSRRLAETVVGGDANARIIAITDACLLDLKPIDDERTTFIQVGEAEGNVALTRLAARTSLSGDRGVEVMIEVRSFSNEDVEVPVVVTLDGAPLARENIQLPANRVWSKSFRLTGISTGRLTASIEHAEGLAGDNSISIDLPIARRTTVAVYGPDTQILAGALAAIPRIHVLNAEKRSADVAIFYKQNPPADFGGPSLVISPEQNGPNWQVGDYHYDILAVQDDSSPLVRNVSLRDAVYERMRVLRIADAGSAANHVAAHGTTATGQRFPLLVAIDQEPRQVVFAAQLDHSDLAHRRDLPILLSNAIRWLNPQPSEIAVATSTAGDHDLRPQAALTGLREEQNDNPLGYPWWHWPCWYFSIAAALALLPVEWWLYQRRIIA